MTALVALSVMLSEAKVALLTAGLFVGRNSNSIFAASKKMAALVESAKKSEVRILTLSFHFIGIYSEESE